jgi:hypothetical protein
VRARPPEAQPNAHFSFAKKTRNAKSVSWRNHLVVSDDIPTIVDETRFQELKCNSRNSKTEIGRNGKAET